MGVRYVTGGRERWRAAAALHGETFKTDPGMRYIFHQLEEKERQERISQFLSVLMKLAAQSSGTFDEAWTTAEGGEAGSDKAPACSAVWLSPGQSITSLRNMLSLDILKMASIAGIAGMKRLLFEIEHYVEKAKESGLRKPDGSKITKFYYLFFISTDVEERGKGLSSELIRRFQDKVRHEKIPIWLESSSERSHRLYNKLGFEDKDTWVVGKGVVDGDGFVQPGGSGVRFWGMLWTPGKEVDQS